VSRVFKPENRRISPCGHEEKAYINGMPNDRERHVGRLVSSATKRKLLKRSLYEMLSLFPMSNPKCIALIILKHAKYQKLDFNVYFRF
jgi:hypothetical protein